MTVGTRGLPPTGSQTGGTAFRKTYNSFSGVDLVCTFGGKLIGELEGISYSIQREKAPIYSMGSADPRSFSRGKRGIAGSLVFTVFDRNPLLEAMSNTGFISNKYDIPSSFIKEDIDETRLFEPIPGIVAPAVGTSSPTVTRVALDKVVARPYYVDQVLPFDIVITATNEYGAVAQMKIHGVEVMNEGSSMSVDDIQISLAMTFISTHITPWSKQNFIKIANDGQSVDFLR